MAMWYVNGEKVQSIQAAMKGKRCDIIDVVQRLDSTRYARFRIVHSSAVEVYIRDWITLCTEVSTEGKWIAVMRFPFLRYFGTRCVPAYFVERSRTGICARVQEICDALGRMET